MSPAAEADPRKFMTRRLHPSRQIAQKLLRIQSEIPKESVVVLTTNQLKAIAASEKTGRDGVSPNKCSIARRESSIAYIDKAQQLRLKRKRCGRIFPLRLVPCLRRTSLKRPTVVSIQYVTSAGPEPKYSSDRITKTSPIEITEEIFGNRRLIVATNNDAKVRDAHPRLNSEG